MYGKERKQSRVRIRNSGAYRQNQNPCGTNISWKESLNCVPRRCADSCECFGITPACPIYKPDDICIRCSEIPRWNFNKRSVFCCRANKDSLSLSFVALVLLVSLGFLLCLQSNPPPFPISRHSCALASLVPLLMQGPFIILSCTGMRRFLSSAKSLKTLQPWE